MQRRLFNKRGMIYITGKPHFKEPEVFTKSDVGSFEGYCCDLRVAGPFKEFLRIYCFVFIALLKLNNKVHLQGSKNENLY